MRVGVAVHAYVVPHHATAAAASWGRVCTRPLLPGTSKVPLEGFKALQGVSGPQKFQIHKAYGPTNRLPSAHTCFNQLDLIEYESKEQLRERLLLALQEGSEGFGFV